MVVCIVLLALGAMAAGNLLPSEKPIDGAPRFALPSRAVLGLGILAFLCFAIEGAVTDWSALFLTDAKAATPEHGRLSATPPMPSRWPASACSATRSSSASGRSRSPSAAACSVSSASASPSPRPGRSSAPLGFGLVGLGAANIVPVLFSAGARTPGVASGVGVSAVATLGYSGFLVFPPILGFAADLFGLSAAIGIVLAYVGADGVARQPAERCRGAEQ